MRIAIAIDSLAGGGAEKVMLTLAKQFMAMGHETHFIVMHSSVVYELPPALPIHVCFDEKDKDFDRAFRLKFAVARLKAKIAMIEAEVGKFDLFLSNLDKTNRLMTKVGVSPLYVIVHASVEEELQRNAKLGPFAYFKKRQAKKALNGQRLITVSQGIADEIQASKWITPLSIRTIYNPFEFNDITELASHEVADIPAGDYLIHVGRLVKQKRHDILFQAIAKMENKIPVVLLCHHPRKALKMAEKYGVKQRVSVFGFQRNPYPWIKGSKGLFLSSDFEGLPTVLIEALACGIPVVSTDCPHGPKEILTGELSRFLVPRRDPEALANKLDEVLISPPELSEIDILHKVDAAKIAQEYLNLAKQF
ncbi:glycosyltransferase [Shewanella sp. D64]|uniref:glycosyltransferase n=1 Tax=unclassified Shewanella TaxID=196818 RepID=UPI0022BA5FC9|nr:MULTISPECIES: glycosyltransferase [unclassified Shewanella]MEC4727597.1 glycosyltransferase [Shewanella sp. D64]MEC4739848.1 glycosyltransferase [Shewanella sp. E94]WBJ95766.1 glycosyltransferase [Shewanella sp. MTB7]